MERDTTTLNGIGIRASTVATKIGRAVVSDTDITSNTTGLSSVAGGQLISRVNNTLTANATDGAFTGTFAAALRWR